MPEIEREETFDEIMAAAQRRNERARQDPDFMAGKELVEVLQGLGKASDAFARMGRSVPQLEEWKAAVARMTALANNRDLDLEQPAQPRPVRPPTVYVALPRYGGIQYNTMTQLFVAGDKANYQLHSKGGSLLACVFNMLVIEALNKAERHDWWMMVHSDLWPRLEDRLESWGDVLMDEAERVGADVIHAVSPIKTLQGYTSTAVGSWSDVPPCAACGHLARDCEWRHRRRLCVRKELALLPPTFNIHDVLANLEGAFPERPCLLPNTGCLLVKTSVLERFARAGGFAVCDRTVPPELNPKGDWGQECIPEDWNFGYWCARNGVPVYGTTAVQIEHVGSFTFQSWGEWGGAETDEDWAAEAKELGLG